MMGAGITGVILATVLISLLVKPAGADQVTVQAPITVQGPVSVSVPLFASVPVPVSLPAPVTIAAPVTVTRPTLPTTPQPGAGAVTGIGRSLVTTASTTVASLTSMTKAALTPVLDAGIAGPNSPLGPVGPATGGGASALSAFPALAGRSGAGPARRTNGRTAGVEPGGSTPLGSPVTPAKAPWAPQTPSPQAPNNAGESLASGQGNTPFGSLPPSMLLLPALALGAVVLLRNRTPKLLLDLRFAPPG